MFAVRDTRSGKFLRNFSQSYNHFHFGVVYDLKEKLGRDPTQEEVHDAMWCLDSPSGAKLYKTETGVATSFYGHRYRRTDDNRLRRIPLAEALPWLEIVPVKVTVQCGS